MILSKKQPRRFALLAIVSVAIGELCPRMLCYLFIKKLLYQPRRFALFECMHNVAIGEICQRRLSALIVS